MTQAVETSANVASHLTAMARRSPEKAAIVLSKRRGSLRYEELSFGELDALTDRLAAGLEGIGVRRGTRTALLVPPSRELFALVFALFKVGAVTVLVDPGLGRKNVLRCLEETEPEAYIGIPLAQAVRVLIPGALRSVRIPVTVGRRWFWGGWRYRDLIAPSSYEARPVRPEDPAAILFTSGSTGIPKGALYEHGTFDAQVRAIRDLYGIAADEVDLPTFPLFALFDPALGMTAVIPDMDFTRPALVDPRNVIDAILERNVTNMFGSPALLDTVGRHGAANGVRLPTLRRVISAGAPVRPAILERFHAMLPEGAEVHTPYGATEALPVATIASREIVGETRHATARGEGTCVGRPAGLEVRIIRIDDAPIAEWSPSLEVPQGEVGEVCVKGPVVTRSYWARPEQTAGAKIRDGGAVWHRMGDLGRMDSQGRLWFYGRKAHRVATSDGTFFTDPVEGVLNEVAGVRRSALAAARGRPVALLELDEGADRARVLAAARERAASNPVTRALAVEVFPGQFPVDIRHNAKIRREDLSLWAGSHLG